MADIDEYINQIQECKTGAEMREPIAKALTAIYEQGSNITSLGGHPASYYLKKTQFNRIANPMDRLPIEDPKGGSHKLVQGGGIYFDLFSNSDIEFTLPLV